MASESHTTSLRSRIGHLALWVGTGSFALAILLLLSSYAEWFVGWTGFSTREVRDTGGTLVAYYPAKTFWDWLELLLVPAVLAIGGFLFTRSENRQAREIEHERTQDTIVKDYLDQMTELLLNHQLSCSTKGDDVRSVAQARTLTMLQSVDTKRKAMMVQFLYQARLIGHFIPTEQVRAIIDLSKVDLSGVNLAGVYLGGAELFEVNLTEAQLSGAHLVGTRFFRADLSRVNLTQAGLARADLGQSNLHSANLTESLLSEACLTETDLTNANLREADLKEADLTGCKGVTLNQLLQVKSLHGAKLPKGINGDALGDLWSPPRDEIAPSP